ncbi:MAG: Ig-like domain-containing protein [Planctomycetota bacterium]|nr:Ig-like domain-containing protein [Planctomycetota bacterium]
MRTSLRSYVSASLLTLVFASCSGSGSSGSLQINCSDGAPFCLVSCDLGCGSLGCSITEVAENQRLRFTFNQAVDPASVTGASFSIRTASGITPDGDAIVDGNSIIFQPTIRVVNGVGTFGFARNQTYILSIAGGSTPGQSVRSVSGIRLRQDLNCTITATRGIIDQDNAPPEGLLVNPVNVAAAPVDATIIVRFTEVIEATPFLTAVNPSTPIQYTLRRSRVDPVTGERECDPSTAPLQIEGLPSVRLEQYNGVLVTVVSLKPSFALPGESCIEVRVTGDVRDLSGRSAVPSLHVFFTEPSQVGDINFDEAFLDAQRLDQQVSGGTWSNGARPAQLGGDGRHGSFDPSIGDAVGTSAWRWNTDSFTIPAALTASGQAEPVTDGKFYFTDFILRAGETIRFVGSNPAQIYVRGRTEIHGTVNVNGVNVTAFNAQNSLSSTANIPGQAGTQGGAGGGHGGRGGDRCLGNGPTVSGSIRLEDGRDGESVQLLAGHAYNNQRPPTAGKGSQMFPTNGLNASVTHQMSFVFSGQMNWGGSGGGFGGAGGTPDIQPLTNLTTPAAPPFNVSAPTGGQGFALAPFPASPPANYSSLLHYSVGGSGGGGAGSHPFAALSTSQGKWKAGGGGSGGGGSFVLRGGSIVLCSATSRFDSQGGSGYTINGDNPATPTVELATQPTSWGISAPGGAGSGGSILLQSSSDLTMEGVINTSGGQAAVTGGISPPTLNGISSGGDGANGFYRLEAAGNVDTTGATLVPSLVLAENVGPLTDRDDASGQVSTWRGTGLIFPPDWVRYELDVDLDGDGAVDVTYSDDPSVPGSSGPAFELSGPVRVSFQGARLETATGLPLPGTQGPWRPFVSANAGPSLNSDAVTGFRFELLFNTRDFPDAVVKRLRVTARG